MKVRLIVEVEVVEYEWEDVRAVVQGDPLTYALGIAAECGRVAEQYATVYRTWVTNTATSEALGSLA